MVTMAGDATESALDVGGNRRVSVLQEGPQRGRPFLLAHGAGSNARSPLVSGLSGLLAASGFRVVRFNFPYSEEGRRFPDRAPVLMATWRAVVDLVGEPGAVLAGASMGGRYATMLLAEPDAPPAAACVLFGYPLHPPGRPDRARVLHLPRVRVPMLFLSGTRDPFVTPDLMSAVMALLPQAVFLAVEGADHSFKVRGRPADGIRMELAVTTSQFVEAAVREQPMETHSGIVSFAIPHVDVEGALAWVDWSVNCLTAMMVQVTEGRRSLNVLPNEQVRVQSWTFINRLEQAARNAAASGARSFTFVHDVDPDNTRTVLRTQGMFHHFLKDLMAAGELAVAEITPAGRETANYVWMFLGSALGLDPSEIPAH